MKRYIVIITGIIVMLCSNSCKKALQEQLHSALGAGNFYKTAQDAQSALNGAFSTFKDQTFYQRGIYLVTDLSCDVFRPNNANNDRVELYSGSYTAFNGILYSYWYEAYSTIKNSNDVIVNVPEMDLEPVFKNDIVGNARFLRGMIYFDLVRMFGDVPLVLKNDAAQDLFPSRTSAKLVYDQIVADLQFAEENCLHADAIPSAFTGRVSSEAASAMLARVFLQRARATFAESTDNQSALTQCNKVITYSAAHSNVIGLAPNYADNFDVTKKNGPESIFAIQFGSNDPANANITNLMFDPESVGGFASFLPNSTFYNSYDPDDKRKAVNVGTIDGGTVYISKYHDPNVVAGALGGTNWVVLRYSDILLMQSEAMHNINSGDPNKFNGINQVRTRAGLGGKLLNFTNTSNSDAFVIALLNERLWELCLEGQRRWDLIRLGKFIKVKADQGFTLSNDRLLYPIPQADRDVNKNLTQNPGY